MTAPAAPIASAHQARAWPPSVARPRHAAASASTAKKPIGFGFQMNVDSSIAAGETARSEPGEGAGERAADRAREPPRERDRADPEERDEGRDGDRIAVRERRRGREQEVVEGAVVELADRRLRPEQRDDAVARERDEREHVVALVGVEPAAGVDARQPQQRGNAP